MPANDGQIWDIFQGRHLLYGRDPDDQDYSTRAHLAEVIGLLGPPPLDLLGRGQRSREFFAEDGKSRYIAHHLRNVLTVRQANGSPRSQSRPA